MSEQKNTVKQPADHIDFNLNLKTTLSPLFDAKKKINTKKKKSVRTAFDFLVSFVPSDISV